MSNEMLAAFNKHFSSDNYMGATRHTLWVGYVAGCTRYQDALREAREALDNCVTEWEDDRFSVQRFDSIAVRQSLNTINALLGETK